MSDAIKILYLFWGLANVIMCAFLVCYAYINKACWLKDRYDNLREHFTVCGAIIPVIILFILFMPAIIIVYVPFYIILYTIALWFA